MSEPHECPLSEVIVGVDGDPTWTTAAPYPRPSCNGSGGQGKIRKPPHIKEGQMSEKKPFDAVIGLLRELLKDELKILVPSDHPKLEVAIRILKDWPKWEPLIEAARKVDKKTCLDEMDDCYYSKSLNPWGTEARILGEIRALLEALPDKEKDDLR